MKTSGKVKVVLSNATGRDCNWSLAGFAALLVDGIAAAGTLEHAVELASGLTALLAKDMVKRLPCAEVYPGLSPRLMLMILLMIVLMLMMMIVLLLMIVMMLAHVTAADVVGAESQHARQGISIAADHRNAVE